jgi:hypothetical protein
VLDRHAARRLRDRGRAGGRLPLDLVERRRDAVAGMSLGFVWKLGQRFALVPEIAAYRTPVAIDYSRGSQMLHFGIGMLY